MFRSSFSEITSTSNHLYVLNWRDFTKNLQSWEPQVLQAPERCLQHLELVTILSQWTRKLFPGGNWWKLVEGSPRMEVVGSCSTVPQCIAVVLVVLVEGWGMVRPRALRPRRFGDRPRVTSRDVWDCWAFCASAAIKLWDLWAWQSNFGKGKGVIGKFITISPIRLYFLLVYNSS